MDKLLFYKSIFEREQNRRTELNNAINQPITLITGMVALLYFVFNKIDLKDHSLTNIVIMIALSLCFFVFVICIWYLAASFNNFLGGFKYLDLPGTKVLFEYNKTLEEHDNKTKEEKKQSFEKYLTEKYVEYSDNYIAINDKRSLNLYHAKKFLIVILGIEIITIIFLIIKNL